jgi:hypothetical protein
MRMGSEAGAVAGAEHKVISMGVVAGAEHEVASGTEHEVASIRG